MFRYYSFFSLLFILCYCSKLEAQYKTVVSGRVTDVETGQSIEYANIRIDGTTKGTETDLDGKYELVVNTNQKAKLIF